MIGIFRYHEFKAERAFVVKRKLPNGYIRNFPSIYEGAVFIDDQGLQETILIPGGEPPSGREKSMDISEISRAGPGAYRGFVEKEGNVRWPVVVGSRGF